MISTRWSFWGIYLAIAFGCAVSQGQAATIEIGQKDLDNGLSLKAVYLQSITMDMSGSMMIGMSMTSNDAMSCSVESFGTKKTAMPNMPEMPSMEVKGPDMTKMDRMPSASDTMNNIHLSTYINANSKNKHAFQDGAFIPYLRVCYNVKKLGDTYHSSGHLMPMLASDGPHYGNNIQLDGPGKYSIEFIVSAPQGIHRHTDKETGVPNWWQPFAVEMNFVFIGTGKKGTY